MVEKSCPAIVVHEDDAFRRSLIAALDQHHFTVTFSSDGDEAIESLRRRRFNVVLLGLNLQAHIGTRTLEFLRGEHRNLNCGVIILGDPDPAIRTFAPWADETMMKPVDADYVAKRARAYCGC